jgi:hypothetical protein
MLTSRLVAAAIVSLSLFSASALAHAQVAPAATLAVASIVMSKTADTAAPVTTISRADGRFFVTIRITNPARTATSIKVSVERPGAAPSAGARELAIPAQARYRTVARFPASRPAGHYRIVVRDAAGAELSALEFDVTE